MSGTGSQHAETGVSILAREIALELSRLIDLPRKEEPTLDSKGLRRVEVTLLNIDQAAKYMGRTVKGIRDLARKGILVPIRFDRKIQFRKSDLDEAIERYKI